MGSSGLITEDKSRVESAPLTRYFEKACPIYMSYGMSYHDFWFGPAYMTKFYREAYEYVIEQRDENNWALGMYIYEALCDVSPILHAFSKSKTKPLPYTDEPKLRTYKRKKEKEAKELEVEKERMAFIVQMNNWCHAVSKQFSDKK